MRQRINAAALGLLCGAWFGGCRTRTVNETAQVLGYIGAHPELLVDPPPSGN